MKKTRVVTPYMEIQPKETKYKGKIFRSRLEIRWAIFFDALGIHYAYEPNLFTLDSGEKYLPDFWLPSVGVFVEIKPSGVDGYWDDNRWRSFAHPLIVICGPPWKYTAYDHADLGVADCGLFSVCPKCGRAGFTFSGWAGYIGCGCYSCTCDQDSCRCGKPYKTSGTDTPEMGRAVLAAFDAYWKD